MLDELFDWARNHSAEAGYAGRTNPFEAMVLCILVELKKKIDEIEKRLGI